MTQKRGRSRVLLAALAATAIANPVAAQSWPDVVLPGYGMVPANGTKVGKTGWMCFEWLSGDGEVRPATKSLDRPSFGDHLPQASRSPFAWSTVNQDSLRAVCRHALQPPTRKTASGSTLGPAAKAGLATFRTGRNARRWWTAFPPTPRNLLAAKTTSGCLDGMALMSRTRSRGALPRRWHWTFARMSSVAKSTRVCS